jgi:hypothetical protein
MKQESLKFSGRASNPATKKFSPAQIAAQKLFAERARAGTLGKTVKRKAAAKRNPVTKNNLPDYRKKTDEQLQFIMKDASEAARAMRGLDARAEAKYLDQINDASTVLYERAAKFRERKTNPDKDKPNVYIKRVSQATGAPPTKRLVKRRTKALFAPAGYFPNPEPTHAFARIGKPFSFDGRTWKVSQYAHTGKTIEAYTTDRKSPYRREKFNVSELEGYYGLAGMKSLSRKTNPMVKYTNRAKDMQGDQRVGYAVHMADRPSYQAIAWFSKKDDAVKVAQEASDRTGKQLAVTRVQNYFGAM